MPASTMPMTDAEIAHSFRTAANQKKQVKVLADLNCCSKAEMEKKLVELAKREGVKVYALSQNCRERNMAHDNTVLLGFGKLTEEEIKLGIGALKRAWLL